MKEPTLLFVKSRERKPGGVVEPFVGYRGPYKDRQKASLVKNDVKWVTWSHSRKETWKRSWLETGEGEGRFLQSDSGWLSSWYDF